MGFKTGMELKYGLSILLKILAAGGIGVGAVGGIVIGSEYDEKRRTLNNYEILRDRWEKEEQHHYELCEEDELDCSIEKVNFLKYDDAQRWEFLYYYAALSVLLDKKRDSLETDDDIKKIGYEIHIKDVLKKIDPQKRWQWSFSMTENEDWKRFRKMCFMLLEEDKVEINSFGTPGNYCIWDADVEFDWNIYKKHKTKKPTSNFLRYLDSQKENWELYKQKIKTKKTKK